MSQSLSSQTFYELLEVTSKAPQDEIHRAFQRAKKAYAPDSPAIYTMFTPQEAEEINQMIEEAYAVLSNHDLRKRYDLKLLKLKNKDNVSYSDLNSLPELNLEDVTKAQNLQPSKEALAHNLEIAESIARKEVKKDLPQGYAKTAISQYKVDEAIEEEIARQTEFTGKFLKKVREYKKIELDSLSEKIRVSKNYLKAIEEQEFNSLPAPVFVRGFVVQLCRIYGLEEKIVAKSFMEFFKENLGI